MPPKKATGDQYKKLIDLVDSSDIIKWGKGAPEMKREAWEHVSHVLNAVGGAEKSGEGWKKAFIEWKSHIKAKIRSGKMLNDLEKKTADITGLFISCNGQSNVPELGISQTIEYLELQGDGTLTRSTERKTNIALDNMLEKNAKEGTDISSDLTEFLPDSPITSPEHFLSDVPKTTQEKPQSKKKSEPFKSTRSRKRKKNSPYQFEMYLEYKRSTCTDEESFGNLCAELNNEMYGSKRSVYDWKRVFSEWESKVKAKARRIYFELELTGGGIPIIEILTNLDKQLLEVLSKILIYGLPHIIELGFKKKKMTKCTYQTKKPKKKSQLQKKTTEQTNLAPVLKNHVKVLKNSLENLRNSMYILNKALTKLLNCIKDKNIDILSQLKLSNK